jgi:hypothetical protein
MKGLVKMRYFLDPLDEEYENIEDLSIYYDSISGQFKHKYKCEVCGSGYNTEKAAKVVGMVYKYLNIQRALWFACGFVLGFILSALITMEVVL